MWRDVALHDRRGRSVARRQRRAQRREAGGQFKAAATHPRHRRRLACQRCLRQKGGPRPTGAGRVPGSLSSPARADGLASIARPVRPARRFSFDQPHVSPRPDQSHEHRRRRGKQARSGEPQRSGSRAVRGRLNRRLAHVRTRSSSALTRASHAAVHERQGQDACQKGEPPPELKLGDGEAIVGTMYPVPPNQFPGFAQLPRRRWTLCRRRNAARFMLDLRHGASGETSWPLGAVRSDQPGLRNWMM